MKKTLLFFTLILWVFLGNAQTTQTVKLPLKLENVSLGSSKDSILVIGMDGVVRRIKTSSITAQDPTKLPLTGGSINGGLAVKGAFSSSFYEDDLYGDSIIFGYDRNYASYVIAGKEYPEAGNLYVSGNISTGGSLGSYGVVSGGSLLSRGRVNATSVEVRDPNNSNNWTLKYGSTGSLEFGNVSGKKAEINPEGIFKSATAPTSPEDLANKKYVDDNAFKLDSNLTVNWLNIKRSGDGQGSIGVNNNSLKMIATDNNGASHIIHNDPSKSYPSYSISNSGEPYELYHAGRLNELRAALGIYGGKYVPSYDNKSSNVTTIDLINAIYSRNGNMVTVNARLTVTKTDANYGYFSMTLPIDMTIYPQISMVSGFGTLKETAKSFYATVEASEGEKNKVMVFLSATDGVYTGPREVSIQFMYLLNN